MNYKVIGVILILLAVVVYIALTYNKADAPLTSPSKVEDSVSLDLASDEFIMFDYTEPAWVGGHVKEDAINAYIRQRYDSIRSDAVDFQAEVAAEAGDLEEEFPKTTPFLPYQLNIDLDRDIGAEYESILLIDYSYTGGAHGITGYESYNLKNGADISFEEYLTATGFTEEQLLTRVNERLSQDEHETVTGFNDAFWRARTTTEETGIEILFPQYVVAPYSAGTITYTLFSDS